MPEALAMGTRMEQQSEFFPRASRAGCRYPEDMADSLHRLSSAAQDLQVLIPCRNRTLLLQGEFCITLLVSRVRNRRFVIVRVDCNSSDSGDARRCRHEHFVRANLCTSWHTHTLSTLPAIVVQFLSIVLIGNKIA